MTDRNNAPLGHVEIMSKLIAYAEENNIAVDHAFDHKVKWMEEHNGVCFCDWESGRVCPCGRIDSDFDKYNGQCLCGLLLTHDRLKMKNDNHARKLARDEKKRLALLEEENNKNNGVDSKE